MILFLFWDIHTCLLSVREPKHVVFLGMQHKQVRLKPKHGPILCYLLNATRVMDFSHLIGVFRRTTKYTELKELARN